MKENDSLECDYERPNTRDSEKNDIILRHRSCEHLIVERSCKQFMESDVQVPKLPYLPMDLMIEIALQMCDKSINNVKKLFLCGREGIEIVTSEVFRKRINLSLFTYNVRLITKYDSFFKQCLVANNPSALYLYGTTLMCVNGDYQMGWIYIERAAGLGKKTAIILNALLYCCNGVENLGLSIIDWKLSNWKYDIKKMTRYAIKIVDTIIQFEFTKRGFFDNTWDFAEPSCLLNHEDRDCEQCFLYNHSKIIKNLL